MYSWNNAAPRFLPENWLMNVLPLSGKLAMYKFSGKKMVFLSIALFQTFWPETLPMRVGNELENRHGQRFFLGFVLLQNCFSENFPMRGYNHLESRHV